MDEGSIIEFSGSPCEPERKQEPNRWKRFLGFFGHLTRTGKLLKKGSELVKAASQAQTNKTNAEAERFAAEAGEIAAREDQTRQVTVGVVNDQIERIFSNKDLPDVAKQLQLATLLEANPGIADQIERVNLIYERLRLIHGTTVAQLPADASPGEAPAEKAGEAVE